MNACGAHLKEPHACGAHLNEGVKVATDGCDGMSDAVAARGASQLLAGAGAVAARGAGQLRQGYIVLCAQGGRVQGFRFTLSCECTGWQGSGVQGHNILWVHRVAGFRVTLSCVRKGWQGSGVQGHNILCVHRVAGFRGSGSHKPNILECVAASGRLQACPCRLMPLPPPVMHDCSCLLLPTSACRYVPSAQYCPSSHGVHTACNSAAVSSSSTLLLSPRYARREQREPAGHRKLAAWAVALQGQPMEGQRASGQ